MRKLILNCSLVLFTLLSGIASVAQDAPAATEPAKEAAAPVHYYHLSFVVQEVGADNKPVNSRVYTTTVSTAPHSHSSMRTGSRIPIATGSYGGDEKSMVNTQFQYVDVGVNVDVNSVHEIDRQLVLDLSADVSSVAAVSDPRLHQPIIRQNKWQSVAFIPIGKSTVVFSSDSLDSKGNLQLLVTATQVE
jgi:hypothetical protein